MKANLDARDDSFPHNRCDMEDIRQSEQFLLETNCYEFLTVDLPEIETRALYAHIREVKMDDDVLSITYHGTMHVFTNQMLSNMFRVPIKPTASLPLIIAIPDDDKHLSRLIHDKCELIEVDANMLTTTKMILYDRITHPRMRKLMRYGTMRVLSESVSEHVDLFTASAFVPMVDDQLHPVQAFKAGIANAIISATNNVPAYHSIAAYNLAWMMTYQSQKDPTIFRDLARGGKHDLGVAIRRAD
ncbi:unnamed protein product [Calypogeia fissa]